MPITPGNQTNAAVDAAPTASFNINDLASAVAAGLARHEQTKQDSAPTTSLRQRIYDQVKGNPDTDEGTWDTVNQLIEAGMEDLKREMRNESEASTNKALAAQRDQSAYTVIRMALDEFIGDDKALGSEREFLRDRVVHRFNNESKYESARAKYSQGDVPIEVFKELAMEEINRLSGGAVKTKSPTGMRNSDGIPEGKGMNEINEDGEGGNGNGNGKDSVDIKEMTAQEKDLYRASLGTAQRLGHPRDSKEAIALASKHVLNLRKGKARAKEKGLGR